MSLWKAAHLAPEQSPSVLGSRECFLLCPQVCQTLGFPLGQHKRHSRFSQGGFKLPGKFPAPVYHLLYFQDHQQDCPAEITNVQHPQEILEEQQGFQSEVIKSPRTKPKYSSNLVF